MALASLGASAASTTAPGRGRGGRDGADVGLGGAGCRSSCRCSRRRAPPRSGWRRGGTRWTRQAGWVWTISADRSGFSLWASRMASRSGRPPGCRASGPPSRGLGYGVAAGIGAGMVDVAVERVSARSLGYLPEVVGRAQRRFPGLGRPAGAIAAFRKADEEPRLDSCRSSQRVGAAIDSFRSVDRDRGRGCLCSRRRTRAPVQAVWDTRSTWWDGPGRTARIFDAARRTHRRSGDGLELRETGLGTIGRRAGFVRGGPARATGFPLKMRERTREPRLVHLKQVIYCE